MPQSMGLSIGSFVLQPRTTSRSASGWKCRCLFDEHLDTSLQAHSDDGGGLDRHFRLIPSAEGSSTGRKRSVPLQESRSHPNAGKTSPDAGGNRISPHGYVVGGGARSGHDGGDCWVSRPSIGESSVEGMDRFSCLAPC